MRNQTTKVGKLIGPIRWESWLEFESCVYRSSSRGTNLDFTTFYGGGPETTEEQLRKGYTDYKEAVY
jgi:hypothetical protein